MATVYLPGTAIQTFFSASNVIPGVSGTRSAGQGKTTSAVVLHGTVKFQTSSFSFRSQADSILPYDES